MKRYGKYFNDDKRQKLERRSQQQAGGFRCSHCKQWVVINAFIGTANRNHCNLCLWSKHVDEKKGDRKAACQAGMKPIGLTFKQEGWGVVGEIMLVHSCARCPKLSINRIAGDDMNQDILSVFYASFGMERELRIRCEEQGIQLLDEDDGQEIQRQLFGNYG